MGLPRSDLMDPTKTNIPKGQIGFISFLCMNFFTETAKLFPKMQVCIDQMRQNKENYENELAQ